MGHYNHAEYKDALVKRTFATFYTQFTEKSFYKNMKDTRRPEDLVLIFYSSATKEIQKAKQDDSWKWLVDSHVALFVRLIQHCLKEGGWNNSYPELVTRMHNLETKLLRNEQNLTDDAGPSCSAASLAQQPMVPLSYNVNDMPLVKVVSKLFNVPLSTCQSIIDQFRSIWTERAALQDLKAYNNSLSLNTHRTLKRDDFGSDEAFEAWKKAEAPEISKLIAHVIQTNPVELSKSAAPATGVRASIIQPASPYRMSMVPDGYSYGAEHSGDGEGGFEDFDSPYIYIPSDPRQYYQAILAKCLSYDFNDPELPPPDTSGEGPIKIMSKSSTDLLTELSSRWRLPLPSRMTLFLDCIRELYHEQQINLITLDAAFLFFKENTDPNWPDWPIQDQNIQRQLLGILHDDLLREMYEILQHAYDKKAVPHGRVLYILDCHILSDPLFSPPDISEFVAQLKQGLIDKSMDAYNILLNDIPDDADQMDAIHVHDTADNLVKLTEKIQNRFKEPIMGQVNPTLILVEIVYPKFAEDSRDMLLDIMEVAKAKGEEVPVDDAFAVYAKLCEVRRIYLDVFPKNNYPVKIEDILADFVWRWLQITDSKVIGWVDAAIQQDDFVLTTREEHGREPTDDERHTASVVDIFRSFNQIVNDLKKLEWQDEYQMAKFSTALAKTVGQGIGRYCEVLEKLFTFEMDRQTPEQEAAATQTRQQRWLALARDAWSNQEKIEPFQFAPESCVKLNNIEFAKNQLDKLEATMDAEKIASVIAANAPPITQRRQVSYVFTIKIVEAEDLKAMDINGASDPYVVVGDEHQKRLHKTRVIYANLNPRWEETVEITVQGPIVLAFTIWDWDTMGDHDCVGRTLIKLDPANFSDFLPKDLWQDLDTQGRLLIRVSMEGERDDIQFYFGRTFRTLFRTERDMTRQITDKLSAFIHHTLSHAALKNILSKGSTLSSVTSLFSRTGLTGARPAGAQISNLDIAQALDPLTNYFNENFAILNTTLTQSAMIMVMSKLWKEVLVTLESLLVPTLSDKPSMQRQLTQQEVDIVFKWLNIMYDFFYAKDEVTGEGTGVPADILRSPKFHELQSLNFFYFDSTENLRRTSERMASTALAHQQAARQRLTGSSGGFLGVPGGGGTKRSKSVLHSRNLGTMRKMKAEKRKEAQAVPNDDMILRILRMRPEAAGYLKERSRQKDRLAATAAAEAIVRQSIQSGGGRMSAIGPAAGARR